MEKFLKRSSIVVLLIALTAGAYWLLNDHLPSENRGVASSKNAVPVRKPAEKAPEGVPTKLPEKKSVSDEYSVKLVKDKKAPKSKKKTKIADGRAEHVQVELPQDTQTVAFAPESFASAAESLDKNAKPTSTVEVKKDVKAVEASLAKESKLKSTSKLEVKPPATVAQSSVVVEKKIEVVEKVKAEPAPKPMPSPKPTPVVATPPPPVTAPPTVAPPAAPIENTPPALARASEEPTFLDRITFSPTLVYFLAKTRNSSGQEAQLASRVSTGIALTLEQRWTEDFTTNARMGFLQYDFQGIDGMEIKNAKSSSWNGEFAARSRVNEKSVLGGRLMLDENFLVNADTTTGGLKVEKLTRPAIGAFYEGTVWSGQRGHIALVPHLTYASGASANGVSIDSHFSYGIALKGEKLATKFFSATGFEFGYETGKFGSSIGNSTNTLLRFQINFSFDF